MGVGDRAGEAPARLVVTTPRRRPPAPSRGERGPTPEDEDTQAAWRTCTQNILSRSPRCGSCAGRDAGYHVSTVTSPFRPGVRPESARRPVQAYPCARKKKRVPPERPAVDDRGRGRGAAGVADAGLKKSKGPSTGRNSIKGGFSERGLNRTIRYENSDNTALVH